MIVENEVTPEWEVECKQRIHRLCCSLHVEKPTLARAQEIMGDFADADTLIQKLMGDKSVMMSNGNRYEFTHKGLTEHYATMKPMAEEKLGKNMSEVDFASFGLQHSNEVVRGT